MGQIHILILLQPAASDNAGDTNFLRLAMINYDSFFTEALDGI
jgi:hypothetical protein